MAIFGDALKGIGYQINPFDKGKTFNDAFNGKAVAEQPISRAFPASAYNPGATAPDPALAAAQAESARLQRSTQALLASLRPVSPAKVDIAAINAQARRQAEESVNPLYTKKLNDMLARQAVLRGRAQQDYTGNVQTLEEGLNQALETSGIDRARTAEDVATATGQVNTAEDQFQTQSGQQFDDARLAEAQQLAAAGLTTSGVGLQQTRRTNEQQNVSEQQQGEDFQRQRTAQAVLKARTFEDLARSDLLTTQRTEKGKSKAKLDLDRLMEDLDTEEQQSKFDIENQRLGDIAQQTTSYGKAAFNNYLAGIRDPRVLEATARSYGSLF